MLILFKFKLIYILKYSTRIHQSFMRLFWDLSTLGHGENEKRQEWGIFPSYFICLHVIPCEFSFHNMRIFII